MNPLVTADLVSEVRRALDEVTMNGERVVSDTDMEDVASSNFSDIDLGDRLLDAVRYMAVRVRAQYVPSLIEDIEPVMVGATAVLHLLGSRVTVNDVYAKRRTFSGHRKLEATGVQASASNPVFVAEDGEVLVYPDPIVGGTARVAVVKVPTAVGNLDDRFRTAVVQRALFSCYQTLQMGEQAKAAQTAFSTELQPFLLPRQRLGIDPQ